MLEDLRGERDDLHEVLRAQFAGDRSEDAGAAGIVGGVDEDDRVAVETQVAAVGTAHGRLGTDDDRFRDLTLFHRGVRGALLDVHGDDVTDMGVRGLLAHRLDESGPAGAGVIGDLENGTELDHGGTPFEFSWLKESGLGLGRHGSGSLVLLGGLGRHGRGDIGLGDGGTISGDGLLDDRHDAPALQPADRTGLHDLDLVAHLGLVLLVMDVKDGLAVDDLVVERMRGLVGDRDLDGLVAGTARDEADLGFARGALAFGGSGHGFISFSARALRRPSSQLLVSFDFGWSRGGRCPCGACAARGSSRPGRSACAVSAGGAARGFRRAWW
eukprot:TRINITY_DN3532_c1_g1_i10.p1 TRINITY_DN3532_c1_g1~~TRINITY_DN3532_c1_g1_i10.p1  ORF type:complete len:328 (+),score=34.73 TRINITY_DN3532_c1_g1_i10:131-1114(+)